MRDAHLIHFLIKQQNIRLKSARLLWLGRRSHYCSMATPWLSSSDLSCTEKSSSTVSSSQLSSHTFTSLGSSSRLVQSAIQWEYSSNILEEGNFIQQQIARIEDHESRQCSSRLIKCIYLHCGATLHSWCFCFVIFPKFRLPVGLHSSCSISLLAGGTCQKCSTKHCEWGDAPHCTLPMGKRCFIISPGRNDFQAISWGIVEVCN